MNPLHRLLQKTADDLRDAEVGFALVGGLAVSVRTEPRFTQDVDLAVAAKDDEAAEAVVRFMTASGYPTAEVLEQTSAGRLATVRFNVGAGRSRRKVDLLFASSGIEQEVVADAQPLDIAKGLQVPTAQLPHLIAMKTLSVSERRPKDLADLQALIAAASDAHISLAQKLVLLIVERGYHNDRDLAAELEGHLQRWRGLA